MKIKCIITTLFILISVGLYSQNIVELVKELSRSSYFSVTVDEFEQALSYFHEPDSLTQYPAINLTAVDIKNGYLAGNTPDNEITVCYWNMSNGKKLLCYSIWACGPVCGSEWQFFEYSKEDGIQQVNQRIEVNDFINESEYFDFESMKNENSEEEYIMLKSEAYLTYTLSLPQTGKNVILYFQPNLDDSEVADRFKYKVSYKGIELVWNDGKFLKGKWVE